MTKEQILEAVTTLLDGHELGETEFDFFLDTAQAYWEEQRPWVALRAEDTSQSVTSGNTYETEKSLPSNFARWYTRFPIVLCDSNDNPQQYLKECALNLKTAYKNDSSRFYCNYRTNKFYVCGRPSQTLTARLYYIQHGTKISSSDSQTWDLDPQDRYAKILVFTIAVYYKLGVDYDVINNMQGESNAEFARQIFRLMEDWDGELQESSLDEGAPDQRGGRYYGSDGMSGSLSMLG